MLFCASFWMMHFLSDFLSFQCHFGGAPGWHFGSLHASWGIIFDTFAFLIVRRITFWGSGEAEVVLFAAPQRVL